MFQRGIGHRGSDGSQWSQAHGAGVESEWRRSCLRRFADGATGRYARPKPPRSSRRARLLLAGLVLGVLGTVLWTHAHGADLHVVVHGASWHAKDLRDYDGQPYNERNPGVALRADLATSWSVQGGIYRNSYDRDSGYVVVDWTPLPVGPLRAGLFAGVTHNYPINDFGVTGAGGAVLRWQADRLSIALRGVPRTPKTAGAVAIEAGWRL